eukprot:TRINITY_DN7890_c0_g1_i1.p1 TRINITY_DN7890_c0_g1~~TRINITY_DN7890_c0_g1_i1.p1  ORF type:complete len:209 (-),score=23.72 TRINITY_DN7890_c0_g1_i1:131-757(-)
MSVASCVCGRVGVQLTATRPVMNLECVCCDCLQAQDWAHTRGGPAVTPPPLTLLYFPNSISGVVGDRSMLWPVQLRDKETPFGAAIRLATKCCYSFLANDHPTNGNVLSVPVAACSLKTGPLPPVMARIFQKDWNSERFGPSPPSADGAPIIRCDEPDLMTIAAPIFATYATAHDAEGDGQPVADFLASLGPPEVLQLQNQASGRPVP